MRKERHFLDLYALLFHNLCKSICASGLLAKRPAFLCALGSEADGTRSTLTPVCRDRNRKPTWETKISTECLSEFYPVSYLQHTGEKQTNKQTPFNFYDGIFNERVWPAIWLLILRHLLFFRLRDQHPCSLSNPESHVLLLIQSVLISFCYMCKLYTQTQVSKIIIVFWWTQVASGWNLVGDLASILVITSWDHNCHK